jgi:Pyruvate/2-oxoacid:ferredoxin oxidoreductase gamma subunit
MCWPLIVVAAISAVSAYQASQTRKDQARYQSQVAENNRQVAEWQAADAKERGDAAAASVRRKYAGLQGTQTASLAARGLDISEGSANAILTDTDFFGDYDQRVTKANAAREAWGFKVRASNFAGDAAARWPAPPRTSAAWVGAAARVAALLPHRAAACSTAPPRKSPAGGTADARPDR